MNDEVSKSILSNIQDRAVSPLFGAFVISWSFWNYKLILAILAFIPLDEKISFIETILYPDIWQSILFLGLGPLLTSLAFLFLYPYPARIVFRFWRQRQKELRDIRLSIENESLLTLEESKRIRRQVIEIQSDYDQQIRKLEEELERYRGELAKRDKELGELHEELSASKATESVVAPQSATASDSEISEAIRRRPYRLQFNPKRGINGSKIMMFGPDGKILEGSNDNEFSWRTFNGRLEFLNKEGKVFSRFNFDPTSNLFLHTNDPDTLSIKGQYLVPEPSAAQ
ncbi:hypothetical protein SAMN03159475_1902 [Pseudomonas sp. NFPP33]|nr:hypothetical protein [Pseudomonas sp. NFPP33]SDA56957.1 hypothetical protein SAMN03159475_1902 [Pseudomonas sp. NFPP33]